MIFGVNIDFLRLLMLKRDIFFGLVDHYFEKMWNIYSPLEEYCDYIKKHTSIENRTWLDDSIKKRHGVLLISGHFGGIEYMTITLSVHGFSPVIIARFRTKILLEKTLPRAKETNIEVINADEPNFFFELFVLLKREKFSSLCATNSRIGHLAKTGQLKFLENASAKIKH
jgi:lauroyl/myristoyl acyltransferase